MSRTLAAAVISILAIGSCVSPEEPRPVAYVTIDPGSVTMASGTVTSLRASAFDAAGVELRGRAFSWSTSDSTIALVSLTGTVTAATFTDGTVRSVQISASTGGHSDSATVEITPSPVTSVTVTPAAASVFVGGSLQLSAVLSNSSGQVLTGRTVSWTSSDTTVATVSSTGLVEARSGGIVSITAVSEGANGTTTIATGVRALGAGVSHTMIVMMDGSVRSTGLNIQGQLGDGTFTNRSVPVPILTEVVRADGGQHHTVFLRSDGRAWTTGSNSFGQQADESGVIPNPVLSPTQNRPEIKAVAAGHFHTMMVANDGSLYASGRNAQGQLGDGTRTNRSGRRFIMSGVDDVAAGENHTLIIKSDGSLWATGSDSVGQLGLGIEDIVESPTQVLVGVKAVAAGHRHTMILLQDGTLLATGNNLSGQLGDGTRVNRLTPVQVMTGVASVAAGGDHTMILKLDGTLWSTGSNQFGQLGDDTPLRRITPAQVMTGVRAVVAGQGHTVIVKLDGSLWATGRNDAGQLGDGTTTNRSAFVLVNP